MDSGSSSAPSPRSRADSDASDYIQAAQTLPNEKEDGNACIPSTSSHHGSKSDQTESERPGMIRTYLSPEEKRNFRDAYKIYERAQAIIAAKERGEINSSDEYDDESLEDVSSISDLHESEDDDMKEVPIDTYVLSTRIIYPNGEEKYLSGSKDS